MAFLLSFPNSLFIKKKEILTSCSKSGHLAWPFLLSSHVALLPVALLPTSPPPSFPVFLSLQSSASSLAVNVVVDVVVVVVVFFAVPRARLARLSCKVRFRCFVTRRPSTSSAFSRIRRSSSSSPFSPSPIRSPSMTTPQMSPKGVGAGMEDDQGKERWRKIF